ncbi:hypothetical protein KCG43_20210 [Photobacterium sp. WH24]|nr:hypothetical protein [Photobacterium sp. WH24]
MNIKSITNETCVCLEWNTHAEFRQGVEFLKRALGTWKASGDGKTFIWSIDKMAKQLGRGVVTETLAQSLAGLPASPQFLQLVEIILDDWQSVDKFCAHDEPEELKRVLSLLENRRDEIRDNLNLNVPDNGPVSASVRHGRLGNPLGFEEFSASLGEARKAS